jgi:glycosyltransferase involved in cell wall biosynthesis
MKVSVCVPAYERPEMIKDLIRSFSIQDHDDRELCISDDSVSDAVDRAVAEMAIPGVVYHHNAQNMGSGRNLHAALSMASGDVIVVLGDDDLFANSLALAGYANAFTAAPNAQFAYSNLIQVNASLSGTLLYTFFDDDIIYSAGVQAIEHMLLRSILMTGIGLRRSSLIDKYYPRTNLLYPQVELVGRLLVEGDGVGIGSFLCATRSHSEQLGFKAIKGERIKKGQQHGVIEIPEIIRGLIEDYPSLAITKPLLEKKLLKSFTTNIVNEKVVTGNRAVAKNAYDLVKRSRFSSASIVMTAACAIVIILPAPVALWIKNGIRSVIAKRQFKRSGIDMRRLMT